jgi:L-ribulose-5-phosphate 4-epimerase
MLESLKEEVCRANQELPARGVVLYTWGNVSGIDREKNLIVIKPSGVSYEDMKPSDMVVVDLEGRVVEGDLRPSSDTPTHLYLYRAFPQIGGVVHTHSTHAAVFAQAGRDIPALGTTHADYFYGAVPVSRALREDEVREAYEENTGKVIVETFAERKLDPVSVPGILVRNHGPFIWGKNPAEAVYHSVVLEEIAEMAWKTLLLSPSASLDRFVLDKHYQRKHGPHAYYGQK